MEVSSKKLWRKVIQVIDGWGDGSSLGGIVFITVGVNLILSGYALGRFTR